MALGRNADKGKEIGRKGKHGRGVEASTNLKGRRAEPIIKGGGQPGRSPKAPIKGGGKKKLQTVDRKGSSLRKEIDDVIHCKEREI